MISKVLDQKIKRVVFSKNNHIKKLCFLKMDTDKQRIAIVNSEKCKPKRCGLECARTCPVNKTGKICIEVTKTAKITMISETMCIGCNLCVK